VLYAKCELALAVLVIYTLCLWTDIV